MKRAVLYLVVLLSPLLIVIAVNEYSRIIKNQEDFFRSKTPALNPTKGNSELCTWMCHDDTNYCKLHHVDLNSQYLKITDPLYFGIINGLKSTGSYGLANIVVLVILVPGLIYLLLIKSIKAQFEIRKIKGRNDAKSA